MVHPTYSKMVRRCLELNPVGASRQRIQQYLMQSYELSGERDVNGQVKATLCVGVKNGSIKRLPGFRNGGHVSASVSRPVLSRNRRWRKSRAIPLAEKGVRLRRFRNRADS